MGGISTVIVARVEMAQRDLEIHTEAARVALDFELKAKMMKAEENKDGQMEVVLKKIKDHEAYVAKVNLFKSQWTVWNT